MRSGNPVYGVVAIGCMAMMYLVAGVHGVEAQNKETVVAEVKKGVSPEIRKGGLPDGRKGGAADVRKPSEIDIQEILGPIKGVDPEIRGRIPGPDLKLEPCEVLCDRGGGYSEEVCERYGYSNQFTYKVRARLSNVGDRSADFEEGWQVWQVIRLEGLKVSGQAGVSQDQIAPPGGLSLTAGSQMPESNSPTLSNLALAPGRQSLAFIVDPEEHIDETSESNNWVECSWQVVATAPEAPFDLAIAGMRVFPPTGSPWDDFTLVLTVENLGEALFDTIETTCTPDVRLYDAKIDSGEKITTSYSIPGTLIPGVHTFICTVRAPGYSEHDTSNNTMSATFTVNPI